MEESGDSLTRDDGPSPDEILRAAYIPAGGDTEIEATVNAAIKEMQKMASWQVAVLEGVIQKHMPNKPSDLTKSWRTAAAMASSHRKAAVVAN